MAVLSKFRMLTKRLPILRGMLSYATIWPVSCLIQQTMAGKRWENYDWAQMVRFSLYGGLFTAPTLYAWVRLSTYLWPQNTIKAALTKAAVEQITYGPIALSCFFFGMSLLENKSVDEAVNEVKIKFWPTYKVALCFWPFFQSFNFLFVRERNRVAVSSAGSLIWCCFLAYMKQMQEKKKS